MKLGSIPCGRTKHKTGALPKKQKGKKGVPHTEETTAKQIKENVDNCINVLVSVAANGPAF